MVIKRIRGAGLLVRTSCRHSPALSPSNSRKNVGYGYTPTPFRVRGRYSRRESANRGPYHAATSSKLEPCCLMGAVGSRTGARPQRCGEMFPVTSLHSIRETARIATYSLLCGKKSLAPSGDIPSHARGVREQARRAEPVLLIHYWGQGTYGSLASLPQTEERA